MIYITETEVCAEFDIGPSNLGKEESTAYMNSMLRKVTTTFYKGTDVHAILIFELYNEDGTIASDSDASNVVLRQYTDGGGGNNAVVSQRCHKPSDLESINFSSIVTLTTAFKNQNLWINTNDTGLFYEGYIPYFYTTKKFHVKAYDYKIYSTGTVRIPSNLKVTNNGRRYYNKYKVDIADDIYKDLTYLDISYTFTTKENIEEILSKTVKRNDPNKLFITPLSLQKYNGDFSNLVSLLNSSNTELYLCSEDISMEGSMFKGEHFKFVDWFDNINMLLDGNATVTSVDDIPKWKYVPALKVDTGEYGLINMFCIGCANIGSRFFYANGSTSGDFGWPTVLRANSKIDNSYFTIENTTDEEMTIYTDVWCFQYFPGIFIGDKAIKSSKIFNSSNGNYSYAESDIESFSATGTMGSMRSAFYGCLNLKSVSTSIYDNQVTDMSYAFAGCINLNSVNCLSSKTEGYINKYLTTTVSMFYDCKSLESVSLNLTKAPIARTGLMFYGCTSLKTIEGLDDMNTSELTNVSSMFYSCNSLESLDLSKWNTSKLTDLYSLFACCQALKTIGDISSWDTSNVTRLACTFLNCNSLESVDVSNFDTSKVTDMAYTFAGCKSLKVLDVSNFNTSNVTDMGYTFASCSSLTSLDVSNFNTNNVTNMDGVFSGCSSLTSLNVSNFNTNNVTRMYHMFGGCSSVTSLDVSNFNTSKVTTMEYMFYECSSLTSLNVSNFNTSKVKGMYYMFANCTSLSSLDLSKFDTSNVIAMQNMFEFCTALNSLDVSEFNTINVTNMSYMFHDCSSLTSLNVSNFNTSNVTNMSYMFSGCSSLVSLDVSNFNTSNVTNMSYMFSGCSSLVSLDVSNFNTSNVTGDHMHRMFYGCSSLKSINISNFDTSKITDMQFMFYGCSLLESIDLSNADFSNATYFANNFNNCNSLTNIKIKALPSYSSITVSFSDCPLNEESLQYMVNNTTGGCTLSFSDTTKALENYDTYKTQLIAKGFKIN